jgi:DNA modification methylase
VTIALHHGDCLEVMKDIPSRSVDLILCDLPYHYGNNRLFVRFTRDESGQGIQMVGAR